MSDHELTAGLVTSENILRPVISHFAFDLPERGRLRRCACMGGVFFSFVCAARKRTCTAPLAWWENGMRKRKSKIKRTCGSHG